MSNETIYRDELGRAHTTPLAQAQADLFAASDRVSRAWVGFPLPRPDHAPAMRALNDALRRVEIATDEELRAARSAATTPDEKPIDWSGTHDAEGNLRGVKIDLTARIPMPTRYEMTALIRNTLGEHRNYTDAADAALSRIAPHVAALEATARQAEEENARLRERVERAEAALSEAQIRQHCRPERVNERMRGVLRNVLLELRNHPYPSATGWYMIERAAMEFFPLGQIDNPVPLMTATPDSPPQSSGNAGTLPSDGCVHIGPFTLSWDCSVADECGVVIVEQVNRASCVIADGHGKTLRDALMNLNRPAPPPSASAGTGTISDYDLAQELALTFKNAMGPGPWGSEGYLELCRNAELAQARRAKELLGGSKAVPTMSNADREQAAWEIDQRVERYRALTSLDELAGIIKRNMRTPAVRAAFAGRGET